MALFLAKILVRWNF